MVNFYCSPCDGLRGCINVPGDKSITHRALLLAAIADNTSEIHRPLWGEDNRAMLKALESLGVTITTTEHSISVQGVGKYGLQPPQQILDVGNSGTAMRLLTGLLAAQSFDSTLVGDDSLMRRPMSRVVEPLQQMGASIEISATHTAPISIQGGRPLSGIHYSTPIASAQVKSALLLAGFYADGQTCITEPAVTRDHTERMLQSLGCDVRQQDGGGLRKRRSNPECHLFGYPRGYFVSRLFYGGCKHRSGI